MKKIIFIIILIILSIQIGVRMDFVKQAKPNIVFILIDALRANHLGYYGYKRNTSPFIDSFAKKSALFSRAYSQESYTLASMPSFFTSTYPTIHNVLYTKNGTGTGKLDRLAEDFITLPEILKKQGYFTAGFVFNPSLNAAMGLGQGFDIYDDNKEGFDYSLPPYQTFETAKRIHHKVMRLLTSHKKRPVFLYLHYRDVHFPYLPPPPYNTLYTNIIPQEIQAEAEKKWNCRANYKDTLSRYGLDYIISQYDGEIRYVDDQLKRLFEELKKYNISVDNSIFIITADHGEEFSNDKHPGYNEGRDHGGTLYEELIHIPLIISIPHLNPKVITSYVDSIDILPTLLDILDINWCKYSQFQGRSILPLLEGKDMPPKDIYSGGNHKRGVVISGDWKFHIYDLGSKGIDMTKTRRYAHSPDVNYEYNFQEELYNIKDDPLEQNSLIEVYPEIANQLRAKYLDWISKTGISKKAELDEKTKEKLRSLGYLQ